MSTSSNLLTKGINVTTYKTYQEAKLANLNSVIYSNSNETLFSAGSSDKCGWSADPSSHCMTVENFLEAGYRFVEGDVALTIGGSVATLPAKGAEAWNVPSHVDSNRYVLKAKALESKTRTKVEYVLVEFNSDKERAEAFLEGNLYRRTSGTVEEFYPLEKLVHMFNCIDLFRRIETEVTEKDEYLDWFDATRKELGPEKFTEFLYDNGYRVIE